MNNIDLFESRKSLTALLILATSSLAFVSGCAKQPLQVTAQDVEAARQDAVKEVAQARDEASKDLKSAIKEGGGRADILRAKATADFDVAMATAEGNHKVALEQCLMLQASQQPACRDQAESAFEAAKTRAKGLRLARLQ